MLVLTCMLVLVSTCWLVWRLARLRGLRYPPGPVSFPLVGNLPQLLWAGQHPLIISQEHSVRYRSPLTSLSLGILDMVIIHDAKLCRELLLSAEGAGRGNKLMGMTKYKSWGIPMGLIEPDYTPEWRERKRFFLRTLREFGFGTRGAESVCHQATQLIDHLLEIGNNGTKDVLVMDIFNIHLVNVIWKMVADKTFSPTSPEAIRVIELLDEIFVRQRSFVSMVPGLRVFARSELQRKTETYTALREVFFRLVDEHEERLDVNEPKDVIDRYLVEMRKGTPGYDRNNLVISVMDLFTASSETTATTLRWCVAFMMLYPEVRQRCRAEVDQLGKDGEDQVVDLHDLENLPYCRATILEVWRVGATVPQTLLHRTMEPCNLGGYNIPRNTIVIGNLLSTYTDPKYWQDPTQFRPDRFMVGEKLGREPEFFFPFGAGKRVCMGEEQGRLQVCLFFANFLKRLDFDWPEDGGDGPNQNKIKMGLSRIPAPFYSRIRPRKHPARL